MAKRPVTDTELCELIDCASKTGASLNEMVQNRTLENRLPPIFTLKTDGLKEGF